MKLAVQLALSVLATTAAIASPGVEHYESAANVSLPMKFDRSKVVRVLRSTVWSPVLPMMIDVKPEPKWQAKPLKLRFLQPSKTGWVLTPRKGEANVFLRGIEQRDSAIVVNVNGAAWRLEPCAEKKRRACLIPSNDPFTPP